MLDVDLNAFLTWQREKKSRHVSIKLGEFSNHERISIWVYDYELGEGQLVSNVDEIDIENHSLKKKRREYEKLKELFKEDDLDLT